MARFAVSALVMGVVLAPLSASAAFLQRTCPESFWTPVSTNFGAEEFDKDLQTQGNYGKNEFFSWKVHVNSNTLFMRPRLLNWNTETGFDYLMVNPGSQKITGNLGTLWADMIFGAPDNSENFIFDWKSDHIITRAGTPKIDLMQFACKAPAFQTTTAPVRLMAVNQRTDIVFHRANDIAYFQALQAPGYAMVVTLDVNSQDATNDYDLYASTSTSRPDDANFMWRAINGGGSPGWSGETLVIPANTTGFLRAIYIGVRNKTNGHVSVRVNRIAGTRQLTICTQDMTPTQVMAHQGWPNARNTLRRTVLRLHQLTHGNMWLDSVRLKLQSSGLQSGWTAANAFCNADSACDMCMGAYGISTMGQDGCGFQTGMGARVRIPNVRCQGAEADPYHGSKNYGDPGPFSKILAHECGHGLARIGSHTDSGFMLSDQYLSGAYPQCAHTIMNGPLGPENSGYRYSTDHTNCHSNDPAVVPVCPPASNWTTIQNSGVFPGWVFPPRDRSAQPWLYFQNNQRAAERINFTAL